MVAATFEEERLPALPARSSSRDLAQVAPEGAEGPQQQQPGNRPTLSITFPVWMLVVVVLAIGAAVAVKAGATGGSSSTNQTSSMPPAGGHQEFLKHTPVQAAVAEERRTLPAAAGRAREPGSQGAKAAVAEERRALPAASGRAREPGSQGAKVRNETREHDGALHSKGTHNASLETSTNSTHANKTRQHKQHLKCNGGSLAACQCLFACKVFGSQPSQCSGEKAALVDTLIQEALSTPATACRGMQCIVRCAKSLQCFDEAIQKDCRALWNSSAADLKEDKEDPSCRYDCDEEEAEDIVVRK